MSVVIPVLSPDTSLIEQSSCIYLYSFHLPVLLPMGMLLRLLQMNYGFYHLFLSQQTRVGRNTQEIWCGVYSRSSVSSTLRKRGEGIAVDRYERKLS